MKPVTYQNWQHFAINGFFFILKRVTVILLVFAGGLVVSQSTVAPVSTRMLTAYVVEYGMVKIKPYRHLFPKPYMVNLEQETR